MSQHTPAESNAWLTEAETLKAFDMTIEEFNLSIRSKLPEQFVTDHQGQPRYYTRGIIEVWPDRRCEVCRRIAEPAAQQETAFAPATALQDYLTYKANQTKLEVAQSRGSLIPLNDISHHFNRLLVGVLHLGQTIHSHPEDDHQRRFNASIEQILQMLSEEKKSTTSTAARRQNKRRRKPK